MATLVRFRFTPIGRSCTLSRRDFAGLGDLMNFRGTDCHIRESTEQALLIALLVLASFGLVHGEHVFCAALTGRWQR